MRSELGLDSTAATGAPGRSRTCDPLLRRQLLYPLSYRGTGAESNGSAPIGSGNPLRLWAQPFD